MKDGYDLKSKEGRSSYMNDYIKRRRYKWILENGPCQKCGSTEDLEIDHIDRTTKSVETKHIFVLKQETREAELAKCQVLCSSCHLDKTSLENRRFSHGTLAAYQRYRCRCYTCSKFHKEYRRKRYLKDGQ